MRWRHFKTLCFLRSNAEMLEHDADKGDHWDWDQRGGWAVLIRCDFRGKVSKVVVFPELGPFGFQDPLRLKLSTVTIFSRKSKSHDHVYQ